MFSLRKIITTNNSLSIYKKCIRLNLSDYFSHSQEQMDYIHKTIQSDKMAIDWSEFKSNILCKKGALSENNINAVLLKTLITRKKLNLAKLFADHLKQNMRALNLGSINGILHLYYILGAKGNLKEEDKVFILDTYKYLYEKHKLLESKTCENILHALCVVNEWKIALKVLEDIFESSMPSHSAFTTLVATLFKENEREEALKVVFRSLQHGRPLQSEAYEEWIKYVFRKYKDNATIIKYLDEINNHFKDNFIIISEKLSQFIKHSYEELDWKTSVTRIGRFNSECSNCTGRLDSLKLSREEFNLLQSNVKDKLIVGSDLFIKTSPKELAAFQEFIKKSPPFDIVLDALNIAYAARGASKNKRVYILQSVADYFLNRNFSVLILGRQHMLNWSQSTMRRLLKMTSYFFTDDLSQDDPYLITAAILSGPNTGIVSKDILRGHKFKLADMQLSRLFQRWQWENQWMVFCGQNGEISIRVR